MTTPEIHDTVHGRRPGIERHPATVSFQDLVELFWIQQDLTEMTGVFPRQTALEFLTKHLKPQVQSGLLSDAGIRELGKLGTD